MKTDEKRFAVRAISLAVRSALVLMCAAPMLALAQEAMSDEAPSDDVKALIYPTNFFDIGAIVNDQSSTKFGEYNGLNDSGPYVLANFGVKGGSAYGMGDGTTRVEASGTNLGTNSRNIGASVTDQGSWNVGVNYDQLRHYTTDGYQTPFQGNLGGNLFTLLPSFGVINSTTTTTNGVITSDSKGARTLTPNQLASFRGVDVYNQRDTTSVNAGYHFGKEWSFTFEYKRLDESGAKLIGAGTDKYDLRSAGGFNYGGERVSILMDPMEYKNDTFNFALNWVGQQAYMTVGYYASVFHDDYSGVSWSNPFVTGGSGAAPNPATGTSPGAAFPISTESTPPNNRFHQFNLTGGYIFSPRMKLVGGLSYGRNTQNASYDGTYTTVPNTVIDLPVNSLDGKVDIKHADLRFVAQATNALNFSAGFKYNERDNKTASYTYEFLNLGGEEQIAVNIPMSYKHQQFDLGGDWRIASNQHLHLGYEYDQMKRWCNNALANNAQGELPSNAAGYYTTASCVQVPKNKENRLVATYKARVGEKVDFNAGYTYGRRTADVNPSFYNPMQANSEGFENFGYIAFFDASRKQNLFKAGVNWQATDKFTIGVNGRYTKDDYTDSTLGVQNGKSESANVDANYSLSEKDSIGAYFSYQKRTRDLLTASGRNAVAPLSTLWSNKLADRDNTVGVNGRQKGFLKGKLEISEDLTYGLSKTKYYTTLVQNINPAVGNAGTSPNISSELAQFRVTGAYQFDHRSSLLVGYLYQRLKASDYFYNAYLYGFNGTTLIPTNQKAPNYTANTVFMAYRYSFQ
jgi:MtrB/PioB family decaheme-associated outer membrane protein